MKKLLTFIISFLMVMTVFAQSFPLAINGKVIGENVGNLNILLENTRNGDTIITQTTASGDYLEEASSFQSNFFFGDSVRITITSCSGNPKCTQTIQWTGQDQLFLTFDLTDDDTGGTPPPPPPPPPEEEEVETENRATPGADRKTASVDTFFGIVIDIKLDDNKLDFLTDTELYFDGENYDVKEEVFFNGVVLTSIDDDDFGRDPYLTIEEFGVEYRFIFDEQLDLNDISEDEPLELTFLGRDIKIIEASANQITVRSGQDLSMKEGESATVAGKEVIVEIIGENSVSISVDGIRETVHEDEDQEINGLRVLVDDILYKNYAGADNLVDLVVGIETDEKVRSGDFFELFIQDDEDWEWIVELGGTQQYIGIWNTEDYVDIDEDEDYFAIGVGERFFLPNNFLEIQFKDVTETDTTSLTFKVKNENGQDYLYVRGNDDDAFSFGTEEYDRIYLDADGIYDEDLIFITNDKIEIGDSDVFLELGSAIIEDLEILLDMADILFKGLSFAFKDETFMDHLGIIFSDPENAVEEQKGFKVIVPEDRPEVLIVFGRGLPVVVVEDVVVEPVDEEEEDTSEDITDTTIPVVIPEPPVEEEDPVVSVPITPVTPPDDEGFAPNALVVAAGTIVAAALLSLWSMLKNTHLRGKYRWIPGMAGILRSKIRIYKEACKAGNKEEAKKRQGTILKLSSTLTKKYLDNLLDNEGEE